MDSRLVWQGRQFVINDVHVCMYTAIHRRMLKTMVKQLFHMRVVLYTTAKKKRPNQLGYLVGIWL